MSWHRLAQERQHSLSEVGEPFVASVVGDVLVHQPPEALDRVEMRAVGGDETQLDPALRPVQPSLHQPRMMATGIVHEQVDQPLVWIHRLDRDQQHDGVGRIHRCRLQHAGLTGLQVNGAVNLQALTAAGR